MRNHRHTYLLSFLLLACLYSNLTFAQSGCTTNVTINSNSPVCSGNTIFLSATASGGTPGYTYSWTGPNGFTATVSNPSISNSTTAASGTYAVTITDSKGCTATASATVTVNQLPIVSAISGPSGGCVGKTIQLTDATLGGTWSSSNTSIATVDNTGLVSIVGTGTCNITYTVTNNGCTTTVSKTINTASLKMQAPVIACNQGAIHFDQPSFIPIYSNNLGTDTYSWDITTNGGTIQYQSGSSTSQYPYVKLNNGYVYTVALQYTTNGVTCLDTQMIYKAVFPNVTIQNSHDTTVCYNSGPISLTGTASASTNIFSWTSSGTGSFSNSNSTNTTYTPSAADKVAGSVTITLTGNSSYNYTGNCPSQSPSTDAIILRIYPNNTGKDSAKTICSNTTTNYTPSSAISGSTFSWASSVTSGSITGNSPSGTGNITDSLVNLSTSSNAIVTYTITPYVFTPSNISCPGTPYSYVVTLQPRPAVNITNNTASLCTGTTTNIQFNSSIAGSKYTWTSSVISGTATGNSSNATASSTNTINDVLTNSSTTANATVRYRITAIPPTGCSRTDSTSVLIYALPTKAVAGSAQALCNATSTMLTGNTPIVGTGTWTIASGPSGASFSNANSPSTAVNGLAAGTYKFVWSIVNGSCAASTDTVVLVNSAATVSGTLASAATVCAGSNTGTLTLSGYTGSILRWEASADGGATWPTVIANTTDAYTYNNLTATTFYRAVVQSGSCSLVNSPSVAITVTPSSGGGTLSANATVCAASNSGILNLAGYTGTVTRWESSTDNGATWANIANTTSSYSYANITATTLYRAVVQSGSCGNVNSNNVTITVNPQTVAGTLAANNTVCATSNTGTLTLSGYTGNILGWESSTNGSTWTSIANTTNTYTYTNLAATTQFRALVQSGVCNSGNSNAVTITVMQPPTAAVAGPAQALCYVTSTVMAANVLTVGTGTWTQLPGDPSIASFTNINNPYTTVNNLSTGIYHFQWTIANSPCAATSSTVVITIDPPTVPGMLASSATVCATSNTGTLTLSGYTGNILGWESSTNGSTWTSIANTTNTYTYTNLTTTTQFRARVQSGSCASQYSNYVTITVAQPVTNAVAGPDQALCNVTSATMAANTPTSGTGTWTQLPGGPSIANFTNANNPFTTVTNLIPGNYEFQWTIANSPCASSQSIVKVHIDPPTVPGTLASSATVCATSNFGTLTLSGYTTSILQWESSTNNGTTWTPIANTTNTYNYSNIPVTTLFRALVQNGVCTSQYSSYVTITALQAVSSANAGPDQQLCNVTSATMAATLPTSGTGTWTLVSGPSVPSYTDLHDPKTTIGGLSFGTYQFKWTVSNGYCANSEATVNITINTPSVPGTLAANATVCATANAGTLTLSGYSTNILRWESSVDNGNTWSTIANTAASYNYSNLTTNTRFRAVVQNAVCPEANSSAVTVTVFQPVTVANAGPAQTLCNVTSATMAANAATSGSGVWTKVSGAAVTFTNPNDPNTTVTGLTTGTYVLQWTISNGVCASTQSTVQIQVDPPTVPGTLASSATVCATSNFGTLTLSGYSSAVLNWQSSTDNGASWTNIANTTANYTYNNLTTTTLFRANVKSGVCTSQYSSYVTITALQAVSSANAGPDQQLCNVTSATMAATLPTSGTGTWTQVSGSTVATYTDVHDPKTTIGGLSFGTYQFKWTVSNGYCANSEATVNITINTPSVPGTLAANATVCATANAGTLTLSGYSTNILRWESSVDNGNTWSTIANTAASYNYSNLTTNTQYRAVVQNAVCPEANSSAVTVTVFQPVTVANAGPAQTLCNVASATMAANAATSGSGVWTKVSGAAVTFTNPNDPNTTVTGLTTGTYVLQWTISNGVCASTQSTVQIQVDPPTVPGTLASPATVCATGNGGTLSLSGYTSSIVKWQSSIDNGSTWIDIANTASTYNYANLTQNTLFRANVKSGVCAAQNTSPVAITVSQPPTAAVAGPDQQLCNVTSTVLAGNAPTSGIGTWSVVTGSGVTFTDANNPTTTVYGLATGTYQLKWTVTNGPCAVSSSVMNITVFARSTPGMLASDATVCATANGGTVTLNGYSTNIVRWESSTDNGNNWSAIANTTSTYNYANLSTTTQYRALVQNGICPALYSNSVTVNVIPAVSAANAGPDQNITFIFASAQLDAIAPTSGTGKWTQLPGGTTTVSFVNPNDPKTTITGLTYIVGPPAANGVYTFRWTVSNGVCADSFDDMVITVAPPTNPGVIGPDKVVCRGLNHDTLTLHNYDGDVLQWEFSTDKTNWTVIDSTIGKNNPKYVYDNLVVTTYFRALVQKSGGQALYSGVSATITVVQPVTPSDAGTDQNLCNTTTTTMAGNIPSEGTGKWTWVSGTTATTFSNDVDPHTIVNGLTVGTYKFAWTISNGVCADSKSFVNVTVHPLTDPGKLATAATVCANLNSGSLSLSAYTGSILQWESSTNNGGTWSPIANTTDAYTYSNIASSTTYRVLVQNSPCASLYSNYVTITALPAVTTAQAGPTQELCNVSSATLAGNTPSSGTGTWSFVSGPSGAPAVTFNDVHNPTTDVYGLVQGTYKLMWTISNSLCTPSTDVVTITVHPPTNAGSLVAPATVCATSNTGTLSLSGYTGTINKWQSSTNNGASWTDIVNNTSSYTYNNLTATTRFRAEVQNSVCPALPSNDVIITVVQPVTIAVVGPDQQLCNTTSAQLAANTPSSGTGTWSVVSGPAGAAFLNANDPNTVVTGLGAGTYEFQWTISNTTCASSQSTVKITVYPPTVAGSLVAPATVCATSNTGTLNLSGYTGTINKWQFSTNNGGTWADITNNTASYTYNNLTATTRFRAQVQNAVCPSLVSNDVIITVLQAVTIANAGPDQQLCNVASATLAANNPSSGTGTWTQLPGGPSTANFTNANAYNTTVSGLVAGTYEFQWTISNNTCASSQSTVKVTVYAPTVAGSLVAPATVCATSNTGTLNLSGYTGAINKWQSSTNNGVSWTDIVNNTASYIYNNLTATTRFRAEVQNSVCPALPSNDVIITVVQPVTIAVAGPDQQLCNTTSAQLAGNTPTSGTGTWSVVSGPAGAAFLNANDPNTVVTGLGAGTYEFQWTISNTTCASSQSTVKVTVYAPTNAGSLVAPATVCATSNTGTLNLSGYTGTINKWQSSINNGATWADITNTTASYTYNNLTATTRFRAQVQNAVCPSLVSNDVIITVLQAVTIANAGPDQQLCNVASATLAANNPSSGTGTWTQVSGPSTASFANANAYNTTVSSLVAGTYEFQWTISNNTCASSQSTVKVTVYAPTVAGSLVAPATVCVTSNTGTLNLSGYTGAINKWQSSTNNGATWTDIANTTASYTYNNLTATTRFRAEVQNSVCPALPSNDVTITVLQPVTIAVAGPDQQLCNTTSASLAANTPSSGTGIWSFMSGPSAVTFNNPNDPHATVQGLQPGTYQLAWTIFNAACTASTSSVKVTVYAATVAGALAAPATVCATANSGTLTLTGNTGGVNKWQSSIDNGITWADIANTNPSYAYNNLTATTQFRVQVQNGACLTQASTPVTITVLQPVTPAIAGPAQQLCNLSVVKLAGNTPASGTGTWSLLSGPSNVVFADVHDPATTASGLAAGTYKFLWTISNTLCADSKDSVAVTVFPISNGGKLTADAFVCVTGNAGTLQLAGYTGNILRWEFTTDSGANWTNINNLTATYSYNNLTTTTQYRALVQSGVCNTAYSNIVTIRVQPASVGGRLFSGSKAVCATANTDSIRLNGYTGVVQHWEYSTDKGASWTSFVNSKDTYTYTNLTTTTWFRVLIQSGACSSAFSDTLKVQVDSATVAGTLASDAVVCYNSNSGSVKLSGRTGSVLRWEFSVDSTRSWNTLNNNTSDAQQYTNLTATTWYRTWVQNGTCASAPTNVVTITTMLPVTIAQAGPDQLLCDGSTRTTLAANLPTSGVGKWSMASGPSTPSFLNVSYPNTDVSGLRIGVYKFVWTIANDVCNSSSDTVVITIDKLQTGFRLSSINDCGKTNFFFTDTTNTSFGIQSWKWYTPGVTGDTVRTRNHSIAYTADGMQSIALTVQSNSGCINTRQANYKVTVFDFPQANINAVAEICKTQFMKVSPDVYSKDSIAYYLWNLGNGKKSSDSVVTVQYVEDGNYTVKLTVATINRCFDSAFKAITVHPIPAVTITSSANVCKGDTATLKADGATSYIWSDQNNNILCSNCQVLKIQPGASSQYKVVGISQYGCSEIQTTNLHLVQPLKMLAAKGDTICYGQSKQLFAAGASTYTWYPETGLSNKSAASPVASPAQTTTYHVIGKDQYGCFADTAEVKMVVGLPTAISIGKDTVMSAGDILQIKTLSERPDIVKWSWYGSPNLSCYNCPAPQLKVADDVSLVVRATNRYGCISIDTLNIKTFCPGALVFIPNAFSPDGDGINDVLMIQGKGVKVIKSFRIFNRWGEVVFEKMNFQPGDPAYAWDGKVRGKPATPDVFVYICEVICDKGVPSFFKGNITILK